MGREEKAKFQMRHFKLLPLHRSSAIVGIGRLDFIVFTRDGRFLYLFFRGTIALERCESRRRCPSKLEARLQVQVVDCKLRKCR